MILYIVQGIIELCILFILCYFIFLFLYSMIRGAPYAALSMGKVSQMIDIARVKKGEKAVDIGAGDGRIVIALSHAGAIAYGIEINPLLVFIARRKIKKAKVQKNAFVKRGSYWKSDFSTFSLVTVYGIPYIMPALEKKLRKELPVGARVVSNYFSFPHWKAESVQNNIYLYVKKK